MSSPPFSLKPPCFFSLLFRFFFILFLVLLISLITILIGWVLPILVDDSIMKLLKTDPQRGEKSNQPITSDIWEMSLGILSSWSFVLVKCAYTVLLLWSLCLFSLNMLVWMGLLTQTDPKITFLDSATKLAFIEERVLMSYRCANKSKETHKRCWNNSLTVV